MIRDKQHWDARGKLPNATLIPHAGNRSNEWLRFRLHDALKSVRKLFTGKVVLDVGCGAGSWFSRFHEWQCEEIIGLDLSPSMLYQARSVKATGDHLLNGSMLEIPLKDRSVDLIVSIQVMELQPSLASCKEVLKEFARALKLHGLVIFIELSSLDAFSTEHSLLRATSHDWINILTSTSFKVLYERPILWSPIMLFLQETTNIAIRANRKGEPGLRRIRKLRSSFFHLHDIAATLDLMMLRSAGHLCWSTSLRRSDHILLVAEKSAQ